MISNPQLDLRLRNVEGRVPLSFKWHAGTQYPKLDKEQIIFFEDKLADNAKILMRRGSRVFIFESTPTPGTGPFVRTDGSEPLIANWDAGPYEIRAETFESDVATGTAPLTIASTTMVANLNVEFLGGVSGTGYIKANGTVPLTNAWDAGNFAITLGSIVGKSGNLTIAPASGSILLQSAAAENIVQVTAGSTLLTVSVPASTTTIQNVMAFAGTTTSTGQAIGVNSAMTNTGVAGSSAAQSGLQSVYTYQGTSSSALGVRNLAGIRSVLIAGSTGDIGLRANDFMFPGVFSLSFGSAPTNSIGSVGGVSIVNNAVSAMTVGRYVGLGISQKSTNITATTAVGIHCHDNIQMEAGDRLVFDGAATFITGSTQTAGRCSVLTAGDTYLTYSTGNTQLDVFVDAAQAFHFDAGGAAGTSRCYGNLLVSGTGTITGVATLTAGVNGGLVVNTGDLTVTAGNATVTAGNLTVTAGTGQFGGLLTADVGVSATTGNIVTVAGDIISGSDLALASGSLLYFDGIGGTTNAQFAGGLIRWTVGGATQMDIYNSGVNVPTAKKFTIGSTLLELRQATLIHNPAAAAAYTFDVNDSLLVTDDSAGTARPVLDVYRQSTSGNRSVLLVRDGSVNIFEAWSQAGIARLGFYGVTPAGRPSAYTQTYSTATRTFSAYTSDPESGAYTGIDNLQVGTVYATVADLNQLRVAYETLRVFAENVGGLVNSMIDDRQADGLAQ